MTKIIAELCCNHQGNFEIAKKMIDALAEFPDEYKVCIIKFQKRTPKLILSKEEYDRPHPNPKNAFGATYGLHKEALEFTIEQHKILKQYCEDRGFIYSVSAFDMNSVKEVLSLNPKMIKISSANNNDYKLLEYIDNNYNGEIHVSLGMTTREEERKIFNSIKNNRKNLVFYACTSAYPTNEYDICLLELKRLKETYGKYIKAIGFSGHHFGVIPDIAAAVLGAEYIERHFTLDKNMKGTDQYFSLNTVEMLELSKNIFLVNKALTYKSKEILDAEQNVRNRLKFHGRI